METMKSQKNCFGKHVERDQQPRRLRRGCCARSPTQLGASFVLLFAAQPTYAAQQLYLVTWLLCAVSARAIAVILCGASYVQKNLWCYNVDVLKVIHWLPA